MVFSLIKIIFFDIMTSQIVLSRCRCCFTYVNSFISWKFYEERDTIIPTYTWGSWGKEIGLQLVHYGQATSKRQRPYSNVETGYRNLVLSHCTLICLKHLPLTISMRLDSTVVPNIISTELFGWSIRCSEPVASELESCSHLASWPQNA